MLTHNDLKPGVLFTYEGKPFQVLSSKHVYKAQRTATVTVKMRDLLTGSVSEKTIPQGETFEEAEIIKTKARFVFSHRGQYTFFYSDNPSKRFTLKEEQLGESALFLAPNMEIQTIEFGGNIINIELPIKARLKVKEAPPGVRGDRAQGGTKTAVLETGVSVQVPLFVETGDVIEVNTEIGEYVERVEKAKE